jgi:ATP-dependent Clp protease adaptor protein ClpS
MSQPPPDRSDAPRWPDPQSNVARPALPPTRPRQLARYKVVLLNDSSKDLMFVVRTVMELTRLCRAEATHKMWLAHHDGRAVLLVTWLERAELFAEQFAGRQLPVTVEPV